MTDDRQRLTRVLALAMHPQTIPQEALAAFQRARELVKANPALAHPPPQEPPPPPSETKFTARITYVHPDWILILVGSLSKEAYKLSLKYEITFDFSQPVTAVSVIAVGPTSATDAFEAHVQWANQLHQ